MIQDATPDRRVTVVLPVRNGDSVLRLVLDNLLAQSHKELEIVLCDNASTDQTPEICKEYSARESTVRYIRSDVPLKVLANWELGYRQVTTPYFLWAPDDHLHSENFVEALLDALEAAPEAGLAFGEVVRFYDYDAYKEEGVIYPYNCATAGVPIWKRLVSDKNGPFTPYGLFRTSTLQHYRWYEHTVSPDWPLVIYVLVLTDIIQVTGAMFYFQQGKHRLHSDERAQRQSNTDMEKYPTVRLSWRCALASRDAARERGHHRVVPFDFVLMMSGLLWANRRSLLQWALKRY